ncbi:hypothetical protein IWQ60_003040 [Tieghemiomyces parasiticus]|uniref:Uncharacterized protein n=1 Tax=Tieghemiomyces parasiticus TaxID=78921 RepID=A0A9W8E0J9_9FUNG|nr:hypothetical protein IWQ60_003040 [Tieghemiomyces parasiticus]
MKVSILCLALLGAATAAPLKQLFNSLGCVNLSIGNEGPTSNPCASQEEAQEVSYSNANYDAADYKEKAGDYDNGAKADYSQGSKNNHGHRGQENYSEKVVGYSGVKPVTAEYKQDTHHAGQGNYGEKATGQSPAKPKADEHTGGYGYGSEGHYEGTGYPARPAAGEHENGYGHGGNEDHHKGVGGYVAKAY